MATEERNIKGVDEVRFIGPGDLHVAQGDHELLTVHAPGYLIDHIQSEVVDGCLHLGYRNRAVPLLQAQRETFRFTLQLRDFHGITVCGSGEVTAPDLDNDYLRVTIDGSGNVRLSNLTADRLETVITGCGSVFVAGDVEEQDLTVAGSGAYDSTGLIGDFGRVKLTGSGRANVAVSDGLDVLITGSGVVNYAGSPTVTKQIYGSGKLGRIRSRVPESRDVR